MQQGNIHNQIAHGEGMAAPYSNQTGINSGVVIYQMWCLNKYLIKYWS